MRTGKVAPLHWTFAVQVAHLDLHSIDLSVG
jgi:hypothetical protein